MATAPVVAAEPEGIVELIAAVTGVPDQLGDLIEPGAFGRTLAALRPKIVDSHDWKAPIGRVLEIRELMPADPLPASTPDGEPWPREAGALCQGAVQLEHPRGAPGLRERQVL